MVIAVVDAIGLKSCANNGIDVAMELSRLASDAYFGHRICASLYLLKENHLTLTTNAPDTSKLQLLRGTATISERMMAGTKEIHFRISPLSFFQINVNVAQELYNAITRRASQRSVPNAFYSFGCMLRDGHD